MGRNSFFAFCCALVPGAGEMYMGMMKKGLAVMAAFWGVIAIGSFLQIDFLFFLLPVIWFYSFFDTFNVARMTEQQRQEQDDHVRLTFGSIVSSDLRSLISKRQALIGGLLVLIGSWMILRNFLHSFNELLPRVVREIIWQMPSLFTYVAIITLGVYLVRGKKSKPAEEDFVAFKGEDKHE